MYTLRRARMAPELRRLVLAVALLLSAPDNGVRGQSENLPGFQGFYIPNPTSTEALTCGGGDHFITSGTFANCCATGVTKPCTIPTVCAQGTLSYNDGSTHVCGSQFSCVTMTVYAASPAVLPSVKNIFCGQNWVANTVFRATAAATPTSSSTSSFSTSSPPTSSSLAGPAATAATTSSASTSSPQPASGSSGSGSSQAWIAGAVIGPLFAIVGVGLLAFWLGKRRNTQEKAAAAAAQNAANGYSAVPVVGPGSPQPYVPGVDPSQYDPSKYSTSPSQYSAVAVPPYNSNHWVGQQGWPQQQGAVYPQHPQPPVLPQQPLQPQELPGGGPADVELPANSPRK